VRWRAADTFLSVAGLVLLLLALMGAAAQAWAASALPQNLSEEERAWIAQHPVVRVATSADYGPFTFVEGGAVRGMSIDYLERLHQLTGIEFKTEAPASFQTNLQRIGSGEVDVMMSLRDTPERRAQMSFTRPYVSVPAVLLRRRGATESHALDELHAGETVAISAGYAIGPFMEERFPANPLVTRPNDRTLLLALASGEVDAAVMDLAGATHLMRKQGIGNVHFAGDIGFSYDLGIGYRKDWPVLGRILDKALARIDAQERQAIADRWFLASASPGIDPRWLQWGGGVLVLLLGGLAVVLGLNRVLRRQVAQRTEQLHAELAERLRLQGADQARALAEEANAAKVRFLSQASHELRNPLNAVSGFAQLMAADPKHPLDDTQRGRLQHIQHATQQLLALIDDMMSFSRLESGNLTLTVRSTALEEVLPHCLAQVEPAAKARSLDLRCAVDQPANVKVMADPLRLEQVLHNLLSNAVKYNRVGGWIEVRAAPAGNGTVRLEVADGGFGLTPEQQRQLFQPFNRLGRTDQDGTGIGLVICKQLVERMGGVIDVESDPGRGTVFGVSLASAPA
jgi:two-component system sensor histidine kinase EvgS